MKSYLIGAQLRHALKEIPALPVQEVFWRPGSAGYDAAEGERIFKQFPATYVAADGHKVLIHNTQRDSWGKASLERRARHLFMYSESANAIDIQRARFLPNVIPTLEHAQFVLDDKENGSLIYGARFESKSIQLVVVVPKRNPKGADSVSRFLITQFPFNAKSRHMYLPVSWVCADRVSASEDV